MNNKYLFLFTISSVQSFIAQARKTQDLFAGSQILSELIDAGMRATQAYFEHCEYIFPVKNTSSKPNRFLVEVGNPKEDFINIGKNIKEHVQAKLVALASENLKEKPKPNGFDEQLAQVLDIHWAFVKISDYENYAKAYEALEQLLGSVKNVRVFEQYQYQEVGGETIIGEKGRKCNLDGENNALFFGIGTREKYYTLNGLKKDISKIGKASQNEGLSAISFVKRFSEFKDKNGNEIKFPSTAKVALIHDIELLSKTTDVDKLNAWLAFQHFFKNGDFDEQLFFEENLNETYFKNNGLQDYLIKLKQIVETHQKFSHQLKTNHYALILFDGDQMGKWLSGDFLKEEYKTEKLKEFHNKFSGLLAAFGKHARENILNTSKHNGQVVYAGGDDFLGFVNLHHLFDVIKQLRIDFDKLVNNELGTYKQMGEHLTFSAGIVIAHYKAPLSEVLKKAREIEKKAKKQGDRNAFAIAALKHSGEIQECVFKWDSKSNEASACSNWQDLEAIFTMLETETFSNKFITNLTTELYDLAGLQLDAMGKVNNTALFAEIKRLLKRALAKDSDSKVNKLLENNKDFFIQRKIENIKKETPTDKDALKKFDVADYVHSRLIELFKSSQKVEKANTVENFIHALHIIDFMHRKLA
ncbi:type III-B CRISPR-associated protein Cas10/Cmr2 [Rapidithrix thailandica]|uniref:Type III-B CRISPR-associated protein Cas10/Cmr2 n=1 Tax=Rapidithrix thailandica TaxID=413964 RepID=A0AAW9S1H7_9BACT